ncbi:MAG: DUF3299 domain-containing protein [Steroidobacteraceae bacterium]
MRDPLWISRRTALGGACASLLSAFVAQAEEPAAAAKPRPREARMVDWEELLPEKERGQLEDPGGPVHDYLGEDGPAMKQYGSFVTNGKLNGTFVKVPGFVVPLTLSQQGTVSEFLLVPYFGACIHVPPPPPNQIVYVKLDKPARIGTIWDPYWITGVLTTAKKDTNMASAAYTLAGERLEPYKY